LIESQKFPPKPRGSDPKVAEILKKELTAKAYGRELNQKRVSVARRNLKFDRSKLLYDIKFKNSKLGDWEKKGSCALDFNHGLEAEI
jgi:hypothetical protein